MRSLSALAFFFLFTGALAQDAAAPLSCTITQKVLPTITLYSCPGDAESTKTVQSPVQTHPHDLSPDTSGSNPEGHDLERPKQGSGSETAAAPNPDGTALKSATLGVSAPKSSGSDSGSVNSGAQSPDNPASGPVPSTSGGVDSGSNPGNPKNGDSASSTTKAAVVPGSSSTPEVVQVAGASNVPLEMLSLNIIGMIAIVMVWI